MAWNDQTPPGFNSGLNNGSDYSSNGGPTNPSVQPAQSVQNVQNTQNAHDQGPQMAQQPSNAPNPAYPPNPIYPQPPQSQPLQAQSQAPSSNGASQGQPVPQASRVAADGAYSGQALLGAQPGQDGDRPDTADDIWIERTKRAIMETQNDPHRQVQLVQHLSVLYLKERFNREVQADKG